MDVFNLPLFEHHLIIDTRPFAAWEKENVVSSVPCPAPDVATEDYTREGLLVQFLIELVNVGLQPEFPTPIVIYHDSTEATTTHSTWLATRLQLLQSDKVLQIAVRNQGAGEDMADQSRVFTERYDPLKILCDRLREHTREIWIIKGGYEAFKQQYPFLCGCRDFADLKPTPHHVHPSIFVGSRAFTISSESLSQLGVCNLIVDRSATLNARDVCVLHCDVSDDDSENMDHCWSAASLFIDEVISRGERVLIQLHGRSRSASVFMAWLMESQHLSLEQALKISLSKCPRIDQALIFTDQLKRREKPRSVAF